MGINKTGGPLFQAMRKCKDALDKYRFYMGAEDPNQDPSQSPDPTSSAAAVANNDDAQKFCGRIGTGSDDDPDILLRDFKTACKFADPNGGGDAKNPQQWTNEMSSKYSDCKREFGLCRKTQRYMCTPGTCNPDPTPTTSTTCGCSYDECLCKVLEGLKCSATTTATPTTTPTPGCKVTPTIVTEIPTTTALPIDPIYTTTTAPAANSTTAGATTAAGTTEAGTTATGATTAAGTTATGATTAAGTP